MFPIAKRTVDPEKNRVSYDMMEAETCLKYYYNLEEENWAD